MEDGYVDMSYEMIKRYYSDGELVYDMYDCPNCGKHYELYYEKYDYCPNCGQKMNWDGINVD